MKQLFEEKELIGKTISKTLFSGDELWIRFIDDSFVLFKSTCESYGFGDYSDYHLKISDYEIDNTFSELFELGLITKKEHDKAVKDAHRKWEKENEIRIKEAKEKHIAEE
jgi:hypothetical protein